METLLTDNVQNHNTIYTHFLALFSQRKNRWRKSKTEKKYRLQSRQQTSWRWRLEHTLETNRQNRRTQDTIRTRGHDSSSPSQRRFYTSTTCNLIQWYLIKYSRSLNHLMGCTMRSLCYCSEGTGGSGRSWCGFGPFQFDFRSSRNSLGI